MNELMSGNCVAPYMSSGMWMPAAYGDAGGVYAYSSMPTMDPAMQWPWAQGYVDYYPQGQDAQPGPRSGGSPSSSCKSNREDAAGADKSEQQKTTVLLRNLPTDFTRAAFLELLEDEGFDGTFDFVYLPIDFGAKVCLGYAFVNFVTPSDAQRCWQIFGGYSDWDSPKVCEVTWGEPCQGLQAHIDRYRSSPVMHKSIPDEWKPLVFKHGQRVPFPPPTKSISAPKLRRRAGKDAHASNTAQDEQTSAAFS